MLFFIFSPSCEESLFRVHIRVSEEAAKYGPNIYFLRIGLNGYKEIIIIIIIIIFISAPNCTRMRIDKIKSCHHGYKNLLMRQLHEIYTSIKHCLKDIGHKWGWE
jgi:hypothetical protein